MDTQTNTLTDVPTFKLAKVGKDRKRKGGAGWWNGARGAGGGFGGLGAEGAGGVGGLGGFFSGAAALKSAAVLLACGVFGAGAYTVGRMFSSGGAPAPKKIFADKSGPQKYSDMSDVVKADNSIPNSLGYVSGSLDGMTPEERAKKAAEDAAAAKAAEDAAKKKADEDAAAAKAAEESAGGQTAGASAGGATGLGRSSAFGSRFGSLSNGLSGGAGLSGGIGGSFGAMGGAGALSNKSAPPGALGSLTSVAKAGTSHAAANAASQSSGKNSAFGQLRQTASASHAAANTAGDASAATASQPFDGANGGQGNSIDGPGVGTGSTAGPGVGSANNAGGSPISNTGSGGGNCSSGQAVDANGNCQTIATPAAKNSANYQSLIDIALGLIAVAAALLVAEKMFAATPAFPYLKTIATILGVVIAGLGAMVIGMSGDIMIGGIVTAVGAFIGVLAQTMSPAAPNVAANAGDAASADAMNAVTTNPYLTAYDAGPAYPGSGVLSDPATELLNNAASAAGFPSFQTSASVFPYQ